MTFSWWLHTYFCFYDYKIFPGLINKILSVYYELHLVQKSMQWSHLQGPSLKELTK